MIELNKSFKEKSEDSQLLTRSIVQASDSTNDEFYLNDENIKTIIRDLDDISYLLNYFNIDENIDDIKFIQSLPEETKNTLSKVLKYKANTICESLKEWFIENNLTI